MSDNNLEMEFRPVAFFSEQRSEFSLLMSVNLSQVKTSRVLSLRPMCFLCHLVSRTKVLHHDLKAKSVSDVERACERQVMSGYRFASALLQLTDGVRSNWMRVRQ